MCCALCSCTCSSSFCVITVSTVQLKGAHFVQYLYNKILCGNTLNITVTLSLCNTKHHPYTYTLSLFWGFRERKNQECLL